MMKRTVLRWAAAGVAVALLAPTPALGSSTMTGSGGSTTVQLTLTDATFDGPDCLEVPIAVSATGRASMQLDAYRPGSVSTVFTFISLYISPDPQASFLVCPYIDGAGRYIVEGTIDGPDGDGVFSKGEFTVFRAPTRVSRLKAKQRGSIVRFQGRVTAATSRGNTGVDTTVTIRARLAKSLGGTGKWRRITTVSTDQFGNFSVRGTTAQNIRGAEVAFVAAENPWARSARGTTRIR